MSRNPIPLACVQLSSQADLRANLDACEQAIRDAARRGARWVLLPENFAWFGADTDKRAVAEVVGDRDAPIQKRLSDFARDTGTTVIGGGMPEVAPDPSKPYNTCVVFGPAGDLLASYRKIHLFDVELPDGRTMRESDGATPGTDPCVVTLDGVTVGLSICYDLRFPELYRQLVSAGAEVILVPAAFTLQTGKDHWHALLRARAIESTAWVAAAAQWGQHSLGRRTYGHSLVVDPWGTIVAECSDAARVVLAEIDLDYLTQVRARLPCLEHRRLT